MSKFRVLKGAEVFGSFQGSFWGVPLGVLRRTTRRYHVKHVLFMV